ncbi:MAG: hypothetical protein O2799_10005, partial [Planctomycetota bacterium]|nr:hypothetical protein [Planctomycetota bacterium]
MKAHLPAILLLLGAASLAVVPGGCASAEPSAQEPVARSGSVLPFAPEATWSAAVQVFKGLGGATAEVDAASARLRMTWSGARVVAELQPHTSGGTIVRLGARKEGIDSPAT